MRFDYIQVTPDYLDDLCDCMLEWAKGDEDAYTIPQFLRLKGIGYSYMKHFCYQSELVRNTFDIVQAILHTRWFNLAMNKNEIPPHRAKVLMRYLRLYDGHGLDVEKTMREAALDANTEADMRRVAQNYAREKLKPPYQKIYDENDNKRRNREET